MAEVKPTNDSKVPPVDTTGNGVLDGAPPTYVVATQSGVVKVEAITKVWGPRSLICLYIGLALAAYVYSLSGTTTYLYLATATSSFNDHSLLASVGVATAIILAITKPIAAKIADVIGRGEAYLVAIIFYAVGYIILASATSFKNYAGGAVIGTFGEAAIQILNQIVIADITTLRWRGIVSSLMSLPFFINAFVASNIAGQILSRSGWRWGYGMFCIITPAAIMPIMGTLFWAQNRAKKLGLTATDYAGTEEVHVEAAAKRTWAAAILDFVEAVDAIGLFLFTAGWALLLIPLTIVNRGSQQWSSPDIIAMLTLGPIILIAFVGFEAKFAKKPVFPLRFFKSPTIVACALINLFDFVSFYLQFTYQYSFIYITHPEWGFTNQGYFAYTQTLALTFFAIAAGVVMYSTRRLKWMLVAGLIIRLISVGAMIHTKGAHGGTAGLVITQVLQGAGGGIAAIATQTAAQGSVPHQDVATVTAMVLLFAEIGYAIGSAIAGAIWKNIMPGQLATRLAGVLPAEEIDSIFASITTALTYEGTPAYELIIGAYDYTMGRLLIAATVVAVGPVIFSYFVVDLKLGDKQNAVEGDAADLRIKDVEKDSL